MTQTTTPTTFLTATPDLADDRGDPHYVAAPCQAACPVGTDVPSYIGLIWAGRHAEALEAITATNPLSAICGRVCDAPCEPACRRADSDGPLAIRALKRFLLDTVGPGHALPPVAVTRSERVAVVGGGPAGLTAAQDLAEAGFGVDLYEASDRLGGMAVWGIPRFRLPEGIIQRDIDRILAHCPGITVHLNTRLGADVTLEKLKADHAAVVLTIGATQGKTLGVPGDDRPQVLDGVGFLRRVNAGERPTLPSTVLVIGGGDVAMDACRAARRLPGVETVKVLYRRGTEEMPARRDELKGALAEGIEIVHFTQPVAVVDGADGGLALRCVRTDLGPADADGRRRPVVVPGSEHDIPCGMVIAAVGQTAAGGPPDGTGLIDGDRVASDFATMTTRADPQVFAAGDGAFGGSSIVEAMHHGHRVAYYVTARLDGRADPLPYRTPYRTRRVPIAQDPLWEVTPRQEAPFHGLEVGLSGEVEDTYTPETAHLEASRCYRCDAETASADYTVQAREAIFRMARTAPADLDRQRAMLRERLDHREDPFAGALGGDLDEMVFLPANLTRLVIDPYREDCRTSTHLAGLSLAGPLLVSGVDTAPEDVRRAVAKGFDGAPAAYVGNKPLDGLAWVQTVGVGEAPDPAAAVALIMEPDFTAEPPVPAVPDQARGVRATADTIERAVAWALDYDLDVILLDGTGEGPLAGTLAAELAGPPDLTVVRDAIRALRARNAEESVDLLWFGGVRTGTDVAKLLAMGCTAAVVCAAMGFALGGHVTPAGDAIGYDGDLSPEERGEAARLLLQAFAAECSMMAKCTGKTNVHNLEPEDLRALTLATARATGIPMPGRRVEITPTPLTAVA